MEETVRAFDDLVRQGKVMYWGFSEWPVDKVEEALKVCGDRYYKPKGSQPRVYALHRQWEAELFPLCQQAGIGQVVFSPLAQGVLSGKYKPGQPAPADSRASDSRQNKFIGKFMGDEMLAQSSAFSRSRPSRAARWRTRAGVVPAAAGSHQLHHRGIQTAADRRQRGGQRRQAQRGNDHAPSTMCCAPAE